MRGSRVNVLHPTYIHDPAGDETVEWDSESVSDVLVSPGDTDDLSESDRLHETRAVLKLAFPKGYESDLRGCRVEYEGVTYAIEGDPRPLRKNCPTRWWMTAQAVMIDG